MRRFSIDLSPECYVTDHRKKDETVVIATKKNFWASQESLVFPNRVHTWILWGYSEDRFNTFLLVIRSWFQIWKDRPKVVIVGQAARAALWLSYLIQWKLLPKNYWIAIDPVYLHDCHSRYYNKVLVYCSNQLKNKNPKHFRYIPLPANGDLSQTQVARKSYFVSIGIAYRDFSSLVAAARTCCFSLIIVTRSRESLGDVGEIPTNVEVRYSIPIQECVTLVAESRGVIVPLLEGEMPHGHSAIVQALRLGKAVISTKRATVDDYIEDGVDGILVEPKDIEGYVEAMKRLWNDDQLLETLEKNALKKAEQFSYAYFADELRKVVDELNHE